ncbi:MULTISPECIES: CPBP family intramembrane glutamic endopeptidase [Bacillus]|uniref:Peptidase n=2 Tax=Bacillus TaxID=1386 RepID=A0A0M4FXS8_9BACI|nr:MULTISPECIES: type II CAAX endopeptidase family protein [Bacillus]ALC83830.1 peptidase [Bacillus gobiensis]MBP1083135.1 membrane protease YdiL (CAAX protease family) [Bacillus capparidis]MED1097915.1 type II CAAX endopeptidase family protein [Bacillus capparidis]
MNKQYWFIILTYVLMHLSSIIGLPLLFAMGYEQTEAAGIWTISSFTICLIVVLLILRTAPKTTLRNKSKASVGASIGWAIGGIFLAYFSQIIAATIEMYIFRIDPGSENTEAILALIKSLPLVIVVSSIFGPILEEIIFRKIIFGSLYKKMNFFFAGLISSVIFAVVHMDFTHILLYTAMGFAFAFLYVRTKRIIVPIIAHISMNTFVVILQLNYDRILELQKELEKMQLIIGGFFS